VQDSAADCDVLVVTSTPEMTQQLLIAVIVQVKIAPISLSDSPTLQELWVTKKTCDSSIVRFSEIYRLSAVFNRNVAVVGKFQLSRPLVFGGMPTTRISFAEIPDTKYVSRSSSGKTKHLFRVNPLNAISNQERPFVFSCL